MWSQVRVKSSSEHRVLLVPFFKWKRAQAWKTPIKVRFKSENKYKHRVKHDTKRKSETETQKEGEGEREGGREQGRRREMQAFDKIPVHNDSLLYICVSGRVAHLYATAAAQCSLANPRYALPACRVETPCIISASLCSSLTLSAGFLFPFPHIIKNENIKSEVCNYVEGQVDSYQKEMYAYV